jgi:hypothetical protein
MPGEAWKCSTVSIMSALQNKGVVDGIDVRQLKYTILDNTNVTYRGSKELGALHLIDSTMDPKEYVAYRPQRLALHETIVAVSTQLKTVDEDDMRYVVGIVYADVLAKLEGLALETLRDSMTAEIKALVLKYQKGIDISKAVNGALVAAICDQVEAKRDVFAQFKETYTPEDAMVARAVDILFSEESKKQIETLVSSVIASQDILEPLTIPSPKDRTMFMVSGGQASGKGSSVARLEESAAAEKIEWDNVVKVNTDSYRLLLLKPGSVQKELYSQLSQPEAATINQSIQKRLATMAHAGKAPHVFVDQVFVGPAQIDLGLLKGGKVRGIIVSTDVGDAIERSYTRGLNDGDEGRYEATKGLLTCHQKMAAQVPTTLSKYSGKNVTFLLVDNNVPKGEQAEDVMEVDLLRRKVQVFSEAKLDRFALKAKINPGATSKEDLYTAGAKADQGYLKPLKDESFDVTIDTGASLQETSGKGPAPEDGIDTSAPSDFSQGR